jgi:hypothetical protein
VNGPVLAQSVDPGRSVGWWSEAWLLFLRSAVRWTALGAVLMLAFGLLSMMPLLGGLVAALLSPVVVGAWMLAAHRVQGGAALDLRSLIPGLRGRPVRALLTLGAWLAGATLLMMLVGHALGAGMLAVLLLLAFSLALMAALWFAPALVVLRGASPTQAALASLRAVRDNGLTFLLYAIVQLLLAAMATWPPYQTGWLVMLPVMLLTTYVSYREVFAA